MLLIAQELVCVCVQCALVSAALSDSILITTDGRGLLLLSMCVTLFCVGLQVLLDWL